MRPELPALGPSWDVVEVVQLLVTEVAALQKLVAAQDARLVELERLEGLADGAVVRPARPVRSAK